MAAKLEINDVRLVLFDNSEKDPAASVVRSYFGDWIVHNGATTMADLPDLNLATVLMFDTFPPQWLYRHIWSLPNLQTMVFGSASRDSTPASWRYRRVSVSHARQGGVSNFEYKASVYEKISGDSTIRGTAKTISPVDKPRQDLRAILKPAKPGRPISIPPLPLPEEPGTGVMYTGKGVLACWGLYNLRETPRPKVITRYGGDVWVVRGLTPLEEATVWDLPEKLSKWFIEPMGLVSFVRTAPCPVKCLQGILETVALSSVRAPESVKRSRRSKKEEQVIKKVRLTMTEIPDSRVEERKALELVDEPSEPLEEEQSIEGWNAQSGEQLKAVKSDDAKAPVAMWNHYTRKGITNVSKETTDSEFGQSANIIRRWMLALWKRRVTRSFSRWVKARRDCGEEPTDKAMTVGLDAVRRAGLATVWGWPAGSTPFFWRWPTEYEDVIMNGLKLWLGDQLKPWTKAQRPPSNPENFEKVREKLEEIRRKGYVEEGVIDALIAFFEVDKGKDDIRMVYDGTKSGLNDSLWAPWFALPTVDTMLRSVVVGTWLGDNDVGEMFLNFMLHEEVRRLCGVDFTLYFPKELSDTQEKLWVRWTRCAMGLKTSPYQATQGMFWAQEVILGDPSREDNVFRWDHVRMNLPGSEEYDSSIPWVAKVRKHGELAADVHCYIDDQRATAGTELECWEATQRISSVLAYLGLQDAARKRRAPNQGGTAWAGSVVRTTDGVVTRMVSQEKWDKTKAILTWIWEQVGLSDKDINYKVLESHRGFLVYVARTYPIMKPYLKGIHATLDSWRPGRDSDGWKTNNARNREYEDGVDEAEFSELFETPAAEPSFSLEERLKAPDDEAAAWKYVPPPSRVRKVGRLRSDIEALRELTSGPEPSRRLVRARKTVCVVYGFGDASGTGFGSSIKINGKTVWKSGQWFWTFKEESSNYRELCNLVLALEDLEKSGELDGCEVFMFTDNSTAESAHFRGTSSSRLLFGLVLRLKKLEMQAHCVIFLIHVAGTRMIHQGTDGLSRGDQNAGIMRGENMLDHVPLNEGCLTRAPGLRVWLASWLISQRNGAEPVFLGPSDWPRPHSAQGVYVWTPPPAAASAAVEWLAQSIHKRASSMHVVLIPRLMSAWWMRMLRKATDVVLVIPAGSSAVWGNEQHEPLILAISLPLRKDAPWRVRGTDEADGLEGDLRGMWKNDFRGTRSVLRKLLVRSGELAAVPQHLL